MDSLVHLSFKQTIVLKSIRKKIDEHRLLCRSQFPRQRYMITNSVTFLGFISVLENLP